jgi:sterol desaturase/sphingolipid hydroxylase (fatty acid hydroxylase superfamily)
MAHIAERLRCDPADAATRLSEPGEASVVVHAMQEADVETIARHPWIAEGARLHGSLALRPKEKREGLQLYGKASMTVTCQSSDVRNHFLLSTFMCYVPLASGLALWAWHDAALPEAAKPALMALGMLVWTLIEYLLHRFLLHYRPQRPALLAVVEKLHLGHHRNPQDESKVTVPVSGSLPIAGGLLGLYRLMTGSWQVAALLMTGSIAGYLYYETVHFWIHCGARRGRWLGQQRANHLSHHFKDQTRCFGVTTQVWDLILGTGRVKSWSKKPLMCAQMLHAEGHLQGNQHKEGTA